jgi:hypothetical protein
VSANEEANVTVDTPKSTRITGDKQHKEANKTGIADKRKASLSLDIKKIY